MGADWLLPIYGLIVGMLVGLTGMGGGVLMTPLLVLGLGMPATAAIGTDLAYSSITKLAGTWQHWRQGTVDMRVVRALAIGSVPATLVAVATLFFLHSVDATAVDAVLERFIGVMLVVAATLMLRKLWREHARHGGAASRAPGDLSDRQADGHRRVWGFPGRVDLDWQWQPDHRLAGHHRSR